MAAYNLAARRVPDCGLVLICSSREALQLVAREDLKSPHIAILSDLPREDVSALYNAASVFVFPSYAEGFGLPIVEAMACGTPVITSRLGAMREVAGDAAALVDPTDTGAIAQAICDIVSDDVLRERLRALGLARARQFSWDETAERLIRLYAQVAGGDEPVAEETRRKAA
jgi:glycosyltransferase involved in cell wall biosynthesis